MTTPAIPSAGDLAAIQELAAKFPWLFRQPDPREQMTVCQVISRYMTDVRQDLGEETFAYRERYLLQFVEEFGMRPVCECSPLDLRGWIRSHPSWSAGHTTHSINAAIQRPFNWAVKMRLIRENPFRGVYYRKGKPQREMKAEEFRKLLRCSTGPFKQVLIFMRLTGCRPHEVRTLRWSEVDLSLGVIRMMKHKTAFLLKNPKPRIIPLVPAAVKLLAYIRRQQEQRQRDPAEIIRELLEAAPLPAVQFRQMAFARGVPKHDFYRWCRQAGVEKFRVGGVGAAGQWFWRLAEHGETAGLVQRPFRTGWYAKLWDSSRGKLVQRKLADDRDEAERKLLELKAEIGDRLKEMRGKQEPLTRRAVARELVFWNSEGQPWAKNALGSCMQRARSLAGLPANVRLYQLRHHYATEAIRNGVGLKVVSELLGHVDCRMTEYYTHIAGDVSALMAGALQATSKKATVAQQDHTH